VNWINLRGHYRRQAAAAPGFLGISTDHGPLRQQSSTGICEPVVDLVYRQFRRLHQRLLLVIVRVRVVLVVTQPLRHYCLRLRNITNTQWVCKQCSTVPYRLSFQHSDVTRSATGTRCTWINQRLKSEKHSLSEKPRLNWITTVLHPFNGLFFHDNLGKPVPERKNQSGFKWGKRWRGLRMQWH